MTDPGQFGSNKPSVPANTKRGRMDCAAVEALLAEAAEGNLSPAVAEQVREHAAGCAVCREKLARTRSGREWLLVLRQEPLQPPAGIVPKILAMTSLKGAGELEDSPLVSSRLPRDFAGFNRPNPSLADSDRPVDHGVVSIRTGQSSDGNAQATYIEEDGPVVLPSSSVPAWQRNSVVVLRRTLLEPRLALVAAMAFFSISLTLNLMGVRLTSMRAADLRPQNLSRAITRQYAATNARMARYYENLRIVYEVESRVQQLRRAAQTSPQPVPTNSKPRKRSSNSSRDSSNDQTESHRGGMAANPEIRNSKHGVEPQVVPDPRPVITGPRLNAAFHSGPRWSLAPGLAYSFTPTFGEPTSLKLYVSQIVLRMPCTLRSSTYIFSKRERRLA